MKFCLLLFVLTVSGPSFSATWQVNLDGSGDFGQMQEAVEFAASGDTIELGPGRHDSWFIFGEAIQYPTRALIEGKDLVILGSSDGETIIGPVNHYEDNPWHHGIVVGDSSRVVIKNIVFENLYTAIINFDNCTFLIEDCQFLNFKNTIMVMGGETQLNNCYFSTNIEGGIQVLSIDQNYLGIANCSFRWTDDETQGRSTFIGIQGTVEVQIASSEFQGADAGITTDFNPNVTIMNCSFSRNKVVCYAGWGGARLHFSGCSFSEQERVIFNQDEGMLLKMDDCVIQDTEIVPFSVLYILKGSYVHNSILEKGARGVVLYHPHVSGEKSAPKSGPVRTIFDMTNNYWGTTEGDSIQAWIEDANDDPDILYFVDWSPFWDQQVPTEKSTLQGIKSFFRQ